MRSASAVGLVGMLALVGCAGARVPPKAALPVAERAPETAPVAPDGPVTAPLAVKPPAVPQGPWIRAAADSDVLLAKGGDAFVGVWVDIPEGARARVRAPVDLALVIDTSGSMEGAKIQAARASARTLVQRLADGDVISVDTFSDQRARSSRR